MLTDRKKIVLKAIIEEYISTAEPVSSGAIVEKYIPDCSSATIRNEMAELEQLGYIEKPHTSAGRIPSVKGYRFYVDELLNDEEGLDKHVSQGGANISGGQKQRLSIARGIAKDAEIYIFDDAFSSLDYKTEKKVRQSIDEKLKDKTKIFISQRILSIKNLDKIIVLDKGRIVGIGNHKQLMESCSLYKQIAQSQFAEEV